MKKVVIFLLFYALFFKCYGQINSNKEQLKLNLTTYKQDSLISLHFILTINSYNNKLYAGVFPKNKSIVVQNDTIKIEYLKVTQIEFSSDDTLFFDLNFFHTGGNTSDGSPPPPGINIFEFPNKQKYTLIFIQNYLVSAIEEQVPIICKFDLLAEFTDVIDIYHNIFNIYEKRRVKKTVGITKSFTLLENSNIKDGSLILNEKYSKIVKIPIFY